MLLFAGNTPLHTSRCSNGNRLRFPQPAVSTNPDLL
jgi:hypothetical protein